MCLVTTVTDEGIIMGKFESLTFYITELEKGNFGEWIIAHEHDGSPEKPIQFPFVAYSETVHRFIEDVYHFIDKHPEMELTKYYAILEKYHVESIEETDVSTLPPECAAALIVGAIRSERFCDGAIYNYLEKGCILQWLKRLAQEDI